MPAKQKRAANSARPDRIASREDRDSVLRRASQAGVGDRDFHPLTVAFLRDSKLAHRKKMGQYFTPRNIREQLLGLLPQGVEFRRILDPSCGTGEFLLSARERYPGAELAGWEIDERAVAVARKISPFAAIKRRDALAVTEKERGTWDLVIGNPPYFEMVPDAATWEKFRDVISGRANVFSFFIRTGLELLRPQGILAFVVPQSMNNGAYFMALRRYILAHGAIVALSPIHSAGHFVDAQQTVMLLVIRKGPTSDNKVFRRKDKIIFSPAPEELGKLFANRRTLAELGYHVRTGRIVWNQCRQRLRRKPGEGELLLWAHNIGERGVVIREDHPKRPQYVAAVNPDRGPAVIVNRITGVASRAVLRAAVVPGGMRFFAENHVNVVYPNKDGRPDERKPQVAVEKIAAALRSPEAVRAARLITGNTQISARELENLVPLKL